MNYIKQVQHFGSFKQLQGVMYVVCTVDHLYLTYFIFFVLLVQSSPITGTLIHKFVIVSRLLLRGLFPVLWFV